jgi:Ca2+-binding RTX toxin-like protein
VVNPMPTGPLAQLANNWGDNILDGNEGNDHVHGGHGDDIVSGREGADRLTGDYGDDILLGGAGADRMSGNRGDALFGGADNDVLEGGSSNDLLMGGAGSDTIDGGTGLDALLLSDDIGNYTIAVVDDQVRLADQDGGIDVITQVEYYRFLADGDTYVVQNGAFTLTTDTEAVDELLSGHLLEDLIEAEAAGGAEVADAAQAGGDGGAAAGAATGSASTGSASAGATTPSGTGEIGMHEDGAVHTYDNLLA